MAIFLSNSVTDFDFALYYPLAVAIYLSSQVGTHYETIPHVK